MGRKDKLRRDRKQTKKPSSVTKTTSIVPRVVDNDAGVETKPELDGREFPKSDLYIHAFPLAQKISTHDDEQTIMDMLVRGATEYGCVRSMCMLGEFHLSHQKVHLALPWFLEGGLRGSCNCIVFLMQRLYTEAKPLFPFVFITYWTKMCGTLNSSRVTSTTKKSMQNEMQSGRNVVERKCRICSKIDTKTLTLRQCMGCSLCCYCSSQCQTIHWEEHNHRNECKQIQILNKYHKPYANDIRDAAIRGETHPKLEKLRSKLGLSRPRDEYEELYEHSIHEGKSINPFEFLIARQDGTVWIGSSPNPIGPPSSSDTDSTTTTTTTTTSPPNDVMSMKVGAMKTELKSYGICTGTFIEKSEFIDALQKARNDADRKPKSTVE